MKTQRKLRSGVLSAFFSACDSRGVWQDSRGTNICHRKQFKRWLKSRGFKHKRIVAHYLTNCSSCRQCHSSSPHKDITRKEYKLALKEEGWKLTKAHGYICTSCAREKKRKAKAVRAIKLRPQKPARQQEKPPRTFAALA